MQGDSPALAGRALSWFLFLATLGVFTSVYLPSREKSRNLVCQYDSVRDRVSRLQLRVARLREVREALAAQESSAIAEAVRETLRKGEPGEYVFPDEPSSPPEP